MEAKALMPRLSEGLLYVDEHLVVLDKPSGLLAVPGRGDDKQDCLSARAQAVWPDALVVHRLDMATSGLFVMARGAGMQRRLSLAFQERQVRKCYEAVVAGVLAAPPGPDGWGRIDLPLAADWPNRPLQKVDPTHGRPSTTRWRIISADRHLARTRVELEPVTGRSHQLRVHLLAVGHPIVGDRLYAPADVAAAAPRLLLHARDLAFRHPAHGESVAFHSPPPF
jgi:tRNA pseudouridine32 synthase/23S rRNA pseudouridine746 synthase